MSLQTIVKQTGNNPKYVIIWLHGLGADGHDFEPIVPQFAISDLPLKFVFPHAPKIPVTINGGMVMRAWYDILSMDIDKRADKTGVLVSEKHIHELIQEQIKLGFDYNRIILAGFSQGSAMSLYVSTHFNKKIAGVIALSGYFPTHDKLELNPQNKDTPFFMGHGTQDPVVPYQLGQSSYQKLIKAGFNVTWNDYPIQHGVSMDEISDIKNWIVENFAKPPS